jgi:ATP-binding cassette subfamily B protein
VSSATFDPLAYYHASRRTTPKSATGLIALARSAITLAHGASPRLFVLVAALQLGSVAVLALQVVLGKLAIERVLSVAGGSTSVAGAILPLAGLVAATSAGGLMTAALGQLQRLLGERVSRVSWDRILAVATSVRLETYESADFFDALQRVKTLAVMQPLTLTQGLFSLAGGLLGVAGVAGAVILIQPLLLPILLAGSVPLLVLSRRTGRMEFDFNVVHTATIRMRAYLTETLIGREEAKEIRAFGLAATLGERWADNYDGYLAAFGAHIRKRISLAMLGALVTVAVTTNALALLLAGVADGSMSLAEAGAALLAVRLLGGRVQQLFTGISGLFESGLFLRDFHAFLDRAEAAPPRPLVPVLAPFAELRAEDVTFRYPDTNRDVLRGVSLTIRAGEVVALVGENGSGKTTLAKILAGLFEATGGRVLWDGRDVRALDGQQRRSYTGVMFQDFVHYQLSARENIGFGRAERLGDLDAVEDAARRAGVAEHLRRLPAGYDTGLGKEYLGGHDLSGGQWQRVALARGFFRDAGFLVLDEPSSALDARAELELFEQVSRLAAGRSVLVISHRFSTVKHADRIVVMHEGELIEQGTHAELMQLGGRYAELFDLQAQSYR